ncbi:MAG: ABC transporter permease subunit [Acidimicrobiia bacterium]|jgi:ABC-type Na+ efflux pump permease subunit
MNGKIIWAVAGNELKQVVRSRDYLLPLGALGLLFFFFVPVFLLGAVTNVTGNEAAEAVGAVINTLPDTAQANIQGDTEPVRASYAVAVYLLAPIAIVVPLTISTAVGATAVVGEREKGTGEFLAHTPASERDIYVGKLIASLIPGYVATVVGFTIYSLVVNVIVGPGVGGWFFPTADWFILIIWVVPPFIAVALSIIVAISARVKTAAAAQQASQLVTLPVILSAYGVATGLLFNASIAALIIGAVAWIAALIGLTRGASSLKRENLIS